MHSPSATAGREFKMSVRQGPQVSLSFDHAPNQSLISVKMVCQLTGLSRSSIYRHIRNGQLSLIKLGGVSRIQAAELRRFMGWSDQS